MKYHEFIKQEGKSVGKRVWVCDYRHNDILKKPIRHVPPKEVEIFDNHDLPKPKKVYYSHIHFRPINKKGAALKQVIAPFDNTGYRSYEGESLNIFLTKEECIEYYLKQCRKVQAEIVAERVMVNKKLDEMIESVEEKIRQVV